MAPYGFACGISDGKKKGRAVSPAETIRTRQERRLSRFGGETQIPPKTPPPRLTRCAWRLHDLPHRAVPRSAQSRATRVTRTFRRNLRSPADATAPHITLA